MSDFVTSMAYCGDVPWHGKGRKIAGVDADVDTMFDEGGLGFRVGLQPAFYLIDGAYEEIPEQRCVVTDSGRALGCVGTKYRAFQNDDARELFKDLKSAAGSELRMVTAGVLHGGRRCWGLAQLAGGLEIRRRQGDVDMSAPYLLGSWSHDGGSAIIWTPTRIRVVCHNTERMAIWSAEDNAREMREKYGIGPNELGSGIVKVRHTGDPVERVAKFAAVLGLVSSRLERERESLQELADSPMDARAFATFAAQILSGLDNPEAALEHVATSEGRAATLYERKGLELARLFAQGIGNRGDSKLDALNAVSEYVDHARGKAKPWQELGTEAIDSSVESALFGFGAQLKVRARQLLAVTA